MFDAFFAVRDKIKKFFTPSTKKQFFPPIEVSEESFLVTEYYHKVRVVQNCDDYQLPAEYDGYEIRDVGEGYDENIPKIIVDLNETRHFADCLALIRQDDPEYTVEKAIRYFLSVTDSFYLDKLNLSKDELRALNKRQLIECLQRISTENVILSEYGYLQIPELIRRTRNEMARRRINKKICGYLILKKDGIDYLLCTSNPELTERSSLKGPLPAILNTESHGYSGKDDNGPPSYTLHRWYGHVTYLTDITHGFIL